MSIYIHAMKELKQMQNCPYYDTMCSEIVGTGRQPCVSQLMGARQAFMSPEWSFRRQGNSDGCKKYPKEEHRIQSHGLRKGCVRKVEESGIIRLLRKHEKPGHFDSQ